VQTHITQPCVTIGGPAILGISSLRPEALRHHLSVVLPLQSSQLSFEKTLLAMLDIAEKHYQPLTAFLSIRDAFDTPVMHPRPFARKSRICGKTKVCKSLYSDIRKSCFRCDLVLPLSIKGLILQRGDHPSHNCILQMYDHTRCEVRRPRYRRIVVFD